MARKKSNSFKTRSTLEVNGKKYEYFDLNKLGADLSRMPVSIKILLENLLRQEDGESVTRADIEAVLNLNLKSIPEKEISFMPARVLLQDFTGVPAVVDLAAMRDAMSEMGGDPAKINPLLPAELVIDHSVQVDHFGTPQAFSLNAELEFDRNRERYQLLHWGQGAFDGFKVVPPDTGIVHQVNIEYLARVVFDRPAEAGGLPLAYPDTLVGTDSHTTMVNGLGVLGWGVGGIEAEAAMLGQPMPLLIPQVIGFRLTDKLPEGSTATDLVLTITEMLRKKGVVGKFVEFYGDGIAELSLANRATIGNMSPEYGSTCAFFPVDEETLAYLRFTNRDAQRVALVEAYCKAQGMFHTRQTPDPVFSDTLELDLSKVEPSLAGPKRPQDRVALARARQGFSDALKSQFNRVGEIRRATVTAKSPISGNKETFEIQDGAVVIAAITSCTNTSNPAVMIGAGLLAKKAVEKGLTRKPWVKTSLAPGSQVVTDYLAAAGLTPYLDKVGFNLVGYGCTTCIGNSGPLQPEIGAAVEQNDIVAVSVLSGNRNFEGRINPHCAANYLASPPLVVAYALAGRMDVDLTTDPVGTGNDGKPVFLKDIWPTEKEVADTMRTALTPKMYADRYGEVYKGDKRWQTLEAPKGARFVWDEKSTYVRRPEFLRSIAAKPEPRRDIGNARVLALLGDSVTTDHISPAGSIKTESAAGKWLMAHGVQPVDFNSYGARRGQDEVMVRGTFANTRLSNQLVPDKKGSWTRHLPDGETMWIYDAAMRYKEESVPLIVLAGKEYGSGSSRDWAAKGTYLLGIRAVIAESFERIHRSNLIGMGVLPLQFAAGQSAKSLGLTGEEKYTIKGVARMKPGTQLTVAAKSGRGKSAKTVEFVAVSRIDTPVELRYYKHGGILPYVLRQLVG